MPGFKETTSYTYAIIDSSVNSAAAGIDATDSNKFKIQVVASGSAIPAAPAQLTIDPSANGNITLKPNGSGLLQASYMIAGAVVTDSSGQMTTAQPGVAGHVLTSNGAGTPPSFQAAGGGGGVTSITGTSNQITASASTGAVTLSTPSTFIAPGSIQSTSTITAGTNFVMASGGQLIIDSYRAFFLPSADETTTFAGRAAGNTSLSGSANAAFGYNGLTNITNGSNNTTCGAYSGQNITGGSGNTLLGSGTGGITSGSGNVLIGYQSGYYYTGAEANNVIISSAATNGDSSVLRIGDSTGTGTRQLNKAFICGIQGITVTGTAVLVSSSDQLGIAVSSARFKKNIKDIGTESNALMSMRPVSFNYKEDAANVKSYGLIAEEVYDILPELVVLDKEGLPQTVKYHELPALLLNEIQKLNKRIEELEKSVCKH